MLKNGSFSKRSKKQGASNDFKIIALKMTISRKEA